MSKRKRAQTKAYQDPDFLNSRDARALRILSEYLEPKSRFDHHKVDDTIVFMGSARIKSREAAEEMLRSAKDGKERERAQTALKMSVYYEAARELATRLTTWSKELDRVERRFVVCTGGGIRQPLRHARTLLPLPLLLHAQVLVRVSGKGGHRVSGRLRDARRAVRAADARADAQDAQAPADRALRHRVLARSHRLRRARAPRDHRRGGHRARAPHRLGGRRLRVDRCAARREGARSAGGDAVGKAGRDSPLLFVSPVAKRLHHRSELAPLVRQQVFRPGRMLLVEAPLDDAVLLQFLQAGGKRIWADVRERFLEILKLASTVEEQVAQDQNGPTVPDDVERADDRAVLGVPCRHSTCIIPVRVQDGY